MFSSHASVIEGLVVGEKLGDVLGLIVGDKLGDVLGLVVGDSDGDGVSTQKSNGGSSFVHVSSGQHTREPREANDPPEKNHGGSVHWRAHVFSSSQLSTGSSPNGQSLHFVPWWRTPTGPSQM